MELILSWIVGFFIWFAFWIIIGLFTTFLNSYNLGGIKGKIPDEVFNYSRKSDILPDNGYFFDTHAHTTASDGSMLPEQLIKWHIANNFNAFVLTDHNTGKNNKEILSFQEKYPEIVIIPGFEWTTMRIHLNFLGIEDFPIKVPQFPSDMQIKEAIEKAHELGAIVQVDHITWTQDRPPHKSGQHPHPTREQLLEWGADGFEINNEMRWYDPKTVDWLERKKENDELKRPIFISTGTDIHNPIKEWATGWTQLFLTDDELRKPNWDIIKKALLEARTRIWVDHDHVDPPESKKLNQSHDSKKKLYFAPFFGLSNGIENIPGGLHGIISWILWIMLAYIPFRILFSWILSIQV